MFGAFSETAQVSGWQEVLRYLLPTRLLVYSSVPLRYLMQDGLFRGIKQEHDAQHQNLHTIQKATYLFAGHVVRLPFTKRLVLLYSALRSIRIKALLDNASHACSVQVTVSAVLRLSGSSSSLLTTASSTYLSQVSTLLAGF